MLKARCKPCQFFNVTSFHVNHSLWRFFKVQVCKLERSLQINHTRQTFLRVLHLITLPAGQKTALHSLWPVISHLWHFYDLASSHYVFPSHNWRHSSSQWITNRVIDISYCHYLKNKSDKALDLYNAWLRHLTNTQSQRLWWMPRCWCHAVCAHSLIDLMRHTFRILISRLCFLMLGSHHRCVFQS